ncbi:MAG: universal stress protein [Salibacteraceae bacterium]
MNSKKVILFPSDFSESARCAMKYGLQLYAGRGYKYILLNTVEPSGSSSSAGMMLNMSEIMTKDSLEGLARDKKWLESQPEAEGCEFETVQMFGEFTACVKHLIKQKPIVGIIMGTTGASGLKEFFVGSNAAAVIQDIQLPTLTVPYNSQFNGISRIVYATDLNILKDYSFLAPIKEIAIKRNAKLSILHVVKKTSKISPENKEIARQNLRDYFGETNPSFETIENNDTVEGIYDYMEQNKDADIIIMVPRKKNFFEKIFSKSVAKKVAHHSSIPMITLQSS